MSKKSTDYSTDDTAQKRSNHALQRTAAPLGIFNDFGSLNVPTLFNVIPGGCR